MFGVTLRHWLTLKLGTDRFIRFLGLGHEIHVLLVLLLTAASLLEVLLSQRGYG